MCGQHVCTVGVPTQDASVANPPTFLLLLDALTADATARDASAADVGLDGLLRSLLPRLQVANLCRSC